MIGYVGRNLVADFRVGLTRAIAEAGVSPLLFSDTFERADTLDGTIGNGWTLKAPYVASYPMPISDYGRIEGGRFVADAGRIVYAQRTESRTVRRFRAVCSWNQNPAFNGGIAVTGAATAAFIISGDANLVNDMGMHVTVARAGNGLFQKRIAGGAFVTLGTITGAQMGLVNTGAPFAIEAWVAPGGAWGLTVNGFTITGTDATLDAHLSGLCAIELYQPGSNHVDLVRFNSVEILSA